jgi:hypothetical protein
MADSALTAQNERCIHTNQLHMRLDKLSCCKKTRYNSQLGSIECVALQQIPRQPSKTLLSDNYR